MKLHWANADQYYVKTTENYASYAFTASAGDAARRVRFEIAAADNEKDNVKEANGRQRRFVLAAGGNAVIVEGWKLVVRFEHRPLTEGEKKRWPGNGGSQQGRINEATVEGILSAADAVDPGWRAALAAPAPTNANGERTLLAKHVDRYTAKNSFDYFIHKDLGGFLCRELDLYLNTQVLNLDDLERGDAARLDRALARVRAIRHIGGKIIDFLAQLEDFQKQLWRKKKFVLETNWCVTLDRVPEALYPEIAANRAQCEEWVELFAVDEIEGDLMNGGVAWSDPPTADFLKANPCLVLDTRHFDRDFTDRLLAALSDARTAGRSNGRPDGPRRELPGAQPAASPLPGAGAVRVHRPTIQHERRRFRLPGQLSAFQLAFDAEEQVDHCPGASVQGRRFLFKHQRYRTAASSTSSGRAFRHGQSHREHGVEGRHGQQPDSNCDRTRISHLVCQGHFIDRAGMEKPRQRCKEPDVGRVGTASRLVQRTG